MANNKKESIGRRVATAEKKKAMAREQRIADGKASFGARSKAEGNITKGETKASIAKRKAKGDKAAKESRAKSAAKRKRIAALKSKKK